MAQTILLAVANIYGFPDEMEKAFIKQGFNVINISPFSHDKLAKIHYPNIWARLETKFRQLILRDKNAKFELLTRLAIRKINKQLKQHQKIDYALFIRPDFFSVDLIEYVKQICPRTIAYQWDGMTRYAGIDDYIPLFERFFVFDPSDTQNPKYAHLLPTTNFYFEKQPENNNTNGKMYFVGAHQTKRQNMIIQFAEYAQQKQWNLDFSLYVWDKTQEQNIRQQYPQSIQFIEHISPFADNLHRVLQSSVLVDFLDNVHHGLSFRSFEALGYRKKLITTNAQIAHYDFYHPHNIYIWDGEHFDGIEEFLVTPYHELSPEIYEKYSFGNWIRYVLNIEPHIKIELPKI